jgi:hypothetical protein
VCRNRIVKYEDKLTIISGKTKTDRGCDATGIFKLKKALDGHMCIKGDVPPQLLSVGNPDQVYEYSTRLIREIGPR